MLLRICLILGISSCIAQPIDFTSEQVREDIEFLEKQLKLYHPGLYRYTSRDSMDYFFDEAKKCENGLQAHDFYGRITFLLSKTRCGHTRSRMSNAMRASLDSGEVFLPFTVKILGDQVFVNTTLDDSLQPGMEIRSINGKSMDEIRSIIYDHISADGYTTTFKRKYMELLFDIYYQLYVDRGANSYRLEVVPPDNEKLTNVVDVEGVPASELNMIRVNIPNDSYLALDHHEKYSYMRIGTFGSGELSRTRENYEKFLKQGFDELKEKQVKNLVLDLRGNTGGRDNYGLLLTTYFADRSFGYFDNIQVTENYGGSSRYHDGKYYMTDHQGLERWAPQANRYEGKVYVLIDGLSFSTCADVATVLHYNDWAIFVGEETGGGYAGNTSGDTRSIRLPHSDVLVSIPQWMYTTANIGHNYEGRGVIPDYEVIPSWEAFEAGDDEVMNKALELIDLSIDR